MLPRRPLARKAALTKSPPFHPGALRPAGLCRRKPHRFGMSSDESNEWLAIGQLAADSEPASDITIRSAVIARAPVKEPAEAIAAAEAAWPSRWPR